MRYPIARVRPLEDDEVDRAEVEAQQCVQLTVTNRSRAYPKGLGSGSGLAGSRWRNVYIPEADYRKA